MVNTIFAFKKGMSLRYTPDARRIPVTELEVKPNVVVGQKSLERDGYAAWQIGIGTHKNASKPKKGQFKNLESTPRFVKEVSSEDNLTLGEIVSLEGLKPGDLVKVIGVSKGKGFAGGIKRWGFHGGPKTHGQSDRHRAPGSIGQGTTPGRVLKGKKMAGHLGSAQATIANLTVWEVDKDQNLIILSGSVPGYRGTLLEVTKVGENKKFVLPEEESTPEVASQDDSSPDQAPKSESQEVEKSEIVIAQETAFEKQEGISNVSNNEETVEKNKEADNAGS